MSAFGIVVEGPRDAAVYPVIIRRIRPDIERVVARPCGGIPALPNKFVGWLKHFQYEHLIDKALVIRDSDWKNPHVLEAELSDRLRKSGFEPTFPVHFYATRSMVETWLLADEQRQLFVADELGIQEVRSHQENRHRTGRYPALYFVEPKLARLDFLVRPRPDNQLAKRAEMGEEFVQPSFIFMAITDEDLVPGL